MTDRPPIPILAGEPLDDSDHRLIALFDKLEADQLTFLDAACKRVIELTTAMLALLFAVIAFGKDFPPSYLVGHPWAKWLMLASLALYLLAMAAGVIALNPQPYRRSRHGLTDMRTELDKMLARKFRWFRIGIRLFFGGSIALAALIVVIIWPV